MSGLKSFFTGVIVGLIVLTLTGHAVLANPDQESGLTIIKLDNLDDDKKKNLFPRSEAMEHKLNAEEYLEDHEYKKALEEINIAIEFDSNDSVYYADRGFIYLKMKKYPEAENDLKKALELDSADTSPYLGLAMIYHEQDNLEKAKEFLIQGATTSLDVEEFKNTITFITLLIGLEKDNPIYYFKRGIAFLAWSGYENKQKENFREALKLDEDDEILNRIFDDDGITDKYEIAKDDFGKAISLDETFADAYAGLAVVYEKQGNLDRSKKEYINASSKYYNKGEYDKSKAMAKHVLELDEEFAPAWHYLGLTSAETSDYEEAVKNFDKAIELGRDKYKPEVLYANRGWANYKLGLNGEAIKDFDESIEFDRSFANPYRGRGDVYFNLHYYANAYDDFNKFLELNEISSNKITDEKEEEYEQKKQRCWNALSPSEKFFRHIRDLFGELDLFLSAWILFAVIETIIYIGYYAHFRILTYKIVLKSVVKQGFFIAFLFFANLMDKANLKVVEDFYFGLRIAIILCLCVVELYLIYKNLLRWGIDELPDWIPDVLKGVICKILPMPPSR